MTGSSTILILEDQPLISMELESLISDAMLGKAVTMTSCEAASRWLEENTPETAVLDLGLKDGDSRAVAEILVERGVPFIVHTAHERTSERNFCIFQHGTWVPKLSEPEDVIGAISQALASSTRASTSQ
jgi:DNA-binding NarL/FixJ family response regulator